MRRLGQTGTKLFKSNHYSKTLDFKDLGQFFSSEVESDGLRIARVVDFDVNLVIILIFPDKRSFQAGHLILLPVDQNLRRKRWVSRRNKFQLQSVCFFSPTTWGGLSALMNSLVCW